MAQQEGDKEARNGINTTSAITKSAHRLDSPAKPPPTQPPSSPARDASHAAQVRVVKDHYLHASHQPPPLKSVLIDDLAILVLMPCLSNWYCCPRPLTLSSDVSQTSNSMISAEESSACLNAASVFSGMPSSGQTSMKVHQLVSLLLLANSFNQ